VCWKPCSSYWSFRLLREEFLSAPIHSPLSESPYRSFSSWLPGCRLWQAAGPSFGGRRCEALGGKCSQDLGCLSGQGLVGRRDDGLAVMDERLGMADGDERRGRPAEASDGARRPDCLGRAVLHGRRGQPAWPVLRGRAAGMSSVSSSIAPAVRGSASNAKSRTDEGGNNANRP
jgi:hypothetical protein